MTEDGNGRSENGAESRSEDSGSSFDELMNEFERETSKPKPKADSKVLKDFSELADYVRQERSEKAQQAVEADIAKAVDFLAESDGLKSVPKDFLREVLEGHGSRNQALNQAFQNRAKDPEAWNKALGQARDRIADTLKGLRGGSKSKDRDDLEAARAAVAGTDNDVSASDEDLPAVPDMMNMSGVEWRNFMQKQEAKAQR